MFGAFYFDGSKPTEILQHRLHFAKHFSFLDFRLDMAIITTHMSARGSSLFFLKGSKLSRTKNETGCDSVAFKWNLMFFTKPAFLSIQ